MSQESQLNNDDLLIDKLIDGELNDRQYRELLSSFDARPDDWRRCALAFLEAQSLRREFGTLATEVHSAVVSQHPTRRRASRGTIGGVSILAVVTSFVVAFSLGMLLRGLWLLEPNRSLVSNAATSAQQPLTVPADLLPNSADATLLDARDDRHLPVGSIQLVVDQGDGGGDSLIDLPVYDADQMDLSVYSDNKPTVPRNVMRELNRMGHQVTEDWQFVPIALQDGRSVVIPVQQVEITPVAKQLYQ